MEHLMQHLFFAGLLLVLSIIMAVIWPELEKYGIIQTKDEGKDADEEAPTQNAAEKGVDVEMIEVSKK